MKVLFLDIDGVLNSLRTCYANGGYPMELGHLEAFDMVAVKLLQRMCDHADIKVVLSSAWRLHYPFASVAKALGLPIIDRTAFLGTARGVEINAWLNNHPEVTHYVIVDDDPDMLPEQKTNFVQTNPEEGLSWANFCKICEIFEISQYDGQARNRDWQKAEKKTTSEDCDFKEVQPWSR